MINNNLNYIELLPYTGDLTSEEMANYIMSEIEALKKMVESWEKIWLKADNMYLISSTAANIVINDVLFGLEEFLYSVGDPDMPEFIPYESVDFLRIMNDANQVNGLITRLDRTIEVTEVLLDPEDAAYVNTIFSVVKSKLELVVDDILDITYSINDNK